VIEIMIAMFLNLFFPIFAVSSLWYALPLIVTVSLVCAATRHEEMSQIMSHAVRFGGWIVVFMVGVMAVLWLMGVFV
jgi:hypothetical protein